MLVAMVVMAAPEDGRFSGGIFDGYEESSTNNSAIPPPPEKGTVIMIR